MGKSISDLGRHHGYLFVHPMLWNARHLEVTGCHFEEVGHLGDIEAVSVVPDQQIEALKKHLKQLATSTSPVRKGDALSRILCYEGSPIVKRVGQGPGFFFAGKLIHRPFYAVLGLESGTHEPLIGHYDYSCLSRYRAKRLEQRIMPHDPPEGCKNHAGARILRKRLANVTPDDWTQDPYFLCILLAIAQSQEQSLTSPGPTTHTSRLIVSNMDCELVYLYEAHIRSELLESLQSPTAKSCVEWPAIKRAKIPFQPITTFRHRLQIELLAPGKT